MLSAERSRATAQINARQAELSALHMLEKKTI